MRAGQQGGTKNSILDMGVPGAVYYPCGDVGLYLDPGRGCKWLYPSSMMDRRSLMPMPGCGPRLGRSSVEKSP